MRDLLLAAPLFLQFLTAHAAPAGRAPAIDLWATWCDYAQLHESPLATVGIKPFGQAMAQTEYAKIRTKTGNVYLGLSVTPRR